MKGANLHLTFAGYVVKNVAQIKVFSFMYAVIQTGGKQYKVSEGDIIRVEKLPGDVGDRVSLSDVLLVGGGGNVTIGAPTVEGAGVTAEIAAQFKGEKVIVFKKKRRQNYRRKQGHRQQLTSLKITGING